MTRSLNQLRTSCRVRLPDSPGAGGGGGSGSFPFPQLAHQAKHAADLTEGHLGGVAHQAGAGHAPWASVSEQGHVVPARAPPKQLQGLVADAVSGIARRKLEGEGGEGGEEEGEEGERREEG